MVNISNFIAKDKTIEVEYPAIPSWKIQLAYVPREELTKILNQSSVIKFSKVSRQREESVDNEKFLRLYVEKVIKGWSGLKVKHLMSLFPVDENAIKGKEVEDVEFSPENAYNILTASADFDRFITDTLNSVEEFNSGLKKDIIKN